MSVKEQTKKEIVCEYLRKELAGGKYPPGSLFLSENVLVRELGFCKNTVREAFSSLVGDGVLERIRGKGTYVCHPAASRNSTVAPCVHLLIEDPVGLHGEDPFIGGCLAGLHRSLGSHGWNIKLHLLKTFTGARGEIEAALVSVAPGEAVVLAGLDCVRELSDPIREAGHPLVCIGRPEDPEVPFVHGDANYQIREAVRFLFSKGHRKIALVDRRRGNEVCFDERRQGFIDVHNELGLIPDARLMVEYRAFGMAAGAEIWSRLGRYTGNFSAVIVYGDWATYGILQAAAGVGISVPEELSLLAICASNLITPELVIDRICNDFNPGLGDGAGQLLLQLATGKKPDNLLLESRLYPGNSVKTIKN